LSRISDFISLSQSHPDLAFQLVFLLALVVVLAGVIWVVLLRARLGFERIPAKPGAGLVAGLAVILIGALSLFFGIFREVVVGGPLENFDRAVFQLLQGLRTSWGDTVMVGVTELGDTAVVAPVTIAVLLWLLWKRAWRTALYFLAAVAAASIFNTAIKVAVHRARPVSNLYVGWSDFSFPSGHSTENATLYGFLAFLVCMNLPTARRITVAFAAAFLVILISFSRIYLGAHWFSDVAGGLALAVAWQTLLMIAYLHHRSPDDRTDGLLIVAVAAVIITGSFNVLRHHPLDMQRYAVKYIVQTADLASTHGAAGVQVSQ
jgi:membrane-associated phospholipid phosphatase